MSPPISPPGPLLYVLARFPSVTETFLYEEIAALSRAGLQVQVCALRKQKVPVLQDEARRLAGSVLYPTPFALLLAFKRWQLRAPLTMIRGAREAWRSRPRSNLALCRHLMAWFCAPWLADCARRSGAQHLHAAYMGPPTTAARAAAQLLGLPFSAAAHAHDIFKETRGLTAKLRAAAFVRVISQYNLRLLRQLAPDLPPERLPLVRCGLGASWFSAPTPRPTSPPTILSVAQLEPYKALDVLIDAAAILRYRKIPHIVLIVGSGSQENALRGQIERLGLGDTVKLLGARRSSAVAALLNQASVFVASARTEESGKQDGIPVALMEAMARQVPVVATRLSGIGELVLHQRTGWLVPPEDPGALAHALEGLLSATGLAARRAAAGRARVQAQHDSAQSATLLALCLRGNLCSTAARIEAPRDNQRRRPRVRLRVLREADDREAVLDIFARSFGPAEAQRRRARWQWLVRGEMPGFVVEAESQGPVGALLTTSVPLWAGDRVLPFRWIGATALLPDWRGAGGQLMGVVRDRELLSSGFPLPRMHSFWQRVDRWGDLVSPADLRSWVRHLRLPLPPCPLRLLRFQVAKLESFDARWDDWLRRATRTWPITLARSSATCNWLFREDPVAPHTLIAVLRNGQPAGYAAIDFYRDNQGKLQAGLGDLFAARGDLTALACALRAASAEARGQGAVSLKALEPSDPGSRRLLRAFGFLAGRSAARPLLLAHAPQHLSSSWYTDLRNWQLSRIWADSRRF